MSVAPVDCPSCHLPLGLFTPRERHQHVEDCLSPSLSQKSPSTSPSPPRVSRQCVICSKDLTKLTYNAALAHANRCVDSLGCGSNGRSERPRSGRSKRRHGDDGREHAERRKREEVVVKACGKVTRLLENLGLGRYVRVFAKEEVDWSALKVMKESDLCALSIPETARRRVAEAVKALSVMETVEQEEFGGLEEGKEAKNSKDSQGCEDTNGDGKSTLNGSRLGYTMKRPRGSLWKSIEQATQFDMDNPGDSTQLTKDYNDSKHGGQASENAAEEGEVVNLITPENDKYRTTSTRRTQGPGVTQLEKILREAENDGILSDSHTQSESRAAGNSKSQLVHCLIEKNDVKMLGPGMDNARSIPETTFEVCDIEQTREAKRENDNEWDTESDPGLRLSNADPVRPTISRSTPPSQGRASPIIITSSPDGEVVRSQHRKSLPVDPTPKVQFQAIISKRSLLSDVERGHSENPRQRKRRKEIVDEYERQVEAENKRYLARLQELQRQMKRRLAEIEENDELGENESPRKLVEPGAKVLSTSANEIFLGTENHRIAAAEMRAPDGNLSHSQDDDASLSDTPADIDQLSECSTDSALSREGETLDLTQREFAEEFEKFISKSSQQQPLSTQEEKLPLADDKALLRCIRESEELYDSILTMETVAFEEIMKTINAGGFRIPKSRLIRFLDAEGISYTHSETEWGGRRRGAKQREPRTKKGSRLKKGKQVAIADTNAVPSTTPL